MCEAERCQQGKTRTPLLGCGEQPDGVAHMLNLLHACTELGFYDLLVAQEELQRPVRVALPPGTAGAEAWAMHPVSNVIASFAGDAVAVPRTPEGPPIDLLPTKVKEGCSLGDLIHMSHWVPLLTVDDDSDDAYRARSYRSVWKEASRDLSKILVAPADEYGGVEEKAQFVADEVKHMEQRSHEWAELAVALRTALQREPIRVAGDGACGVSAIVVGGTGDTAVTAAAKENMRARVSRRGLALAEDKTFVDLFLYLEGEEVPVLNTPDQSPSVLSPAYGDRVPSHVIDEINKISRTLTVQGPQVVLSMLRLFKLYENRTKKLKPGWYFLHAGAKLADSKYTDIVKKTWPSAPREQRLQTSAVAGLVKLGEPVEHSTVRDPWALFGWCHPIEASIEFQECESGLGGIHQGVWHIPSGNRVELCGKVVGGTYRTAAVPMVAEGASGSGAAGAVAEDAVMPNDSARGAEAPTATVPMGVEGASAGGAADAATEAVEVLDDSASGAEAKVDVSEMQIVAHADEGSAPTSKRRKHKFCDAKAKAKAQAVEDPVESLVKALKACASADAVEELIWPEDHFDGMDGEDELYTTIRDTLDHIVESEKSHREIATDVRFTLRRLMPEPFRLAAETLCIAEGWHPESFVSCMDNNIAFLEEPGTALMATDVGEDDAAAAEAATELSGPCAGSAAEPAVKRQRRSAGQDSRKKNTSENQGARVSGALAPEGPAEAGSKLESPQQPLLQSHARPTRAKMRARPGTAAACKDLDPDAHPLEDALELAISRVDLHGGASRKDVKRIAEEILNMDQGGLDEHDAFIRAFIRAKLEESGVLDTSEVPASQLVAHSSQAEMIKAGVVAEPPSIAASAFRHSITPNIAFFMAGAASSRKSSLWKRAVQYMTDAAGAPPVISGRKIFNVESTPKGIRVALLNYSRCTTISDEIVNTFPTPWSDKASTTHYLSRSKANTYTQCEPDDVLTAAGTIHLTMYTYQLKVAGQWEAVEWVLKPTPNGFQKRITFTFAPDRSPHNEAQKSAWSQGLWLGMHAWTYKVNFHCRQLCSYDGFALGMWHTVQRAIGDWIDDQARAKIVVSRWFLVKLNFAFSDVLRFSFVSMRYAGYCTSLAPGLAEQERRVQISASEAVAGIRKWLRQLALHYGYYMYMRGQEAKAALAPRRREQALAEGMEMAAPVARAKPEFDNEMDAIKYELLTDPKTNGAFETKDARLWIKNKLPSRGGANLAENFVKACHELVAAGLLTQVELEAETEGAEAGTEQSKKKKGKHGRKTWKFAKIDLADLSEAAWAERVRLQLPGQKES